MALKMGRACGHTAYPGFPAPGLKGLAYNHGKIIHFDLQQLKGKTVVVLFCPVDFDYISPTEVRIAEQLAPNLQVELVLVAPGSVNSKAAWASLPRQEGGLQGTSFILLGDLDGSIGQAYGMLNHHTGHNYRGLLVIGPDQTITYRAEADLPIGLSVEAAMRHVAAERAGITPPDWTPEDGLCGEGRDSCQFNSGFAHPHDPLDSLGEAVTEEGGDMGEDSHEGHRHNEAEKAESSKEDAAGHTEAAALTPLITTGEGAAVHHEAGGGGSANSAPNAPDAAAAVDTGEGGGADAIVDASG